MDARELLSAVAHYLSGYSEKSVAICGSLATGFVSGDPFQSVEWSLSEHTMFSNLSLTFRGQDGSSGTLTAVVIKPAFTNDQSLATQSSIQGDENEQR